jgi:hypothetical protein
LKLNRLESDIRTATAKLSQNKANDLARIESEIETHQQAIAQKSRLTGIEIGLSKPLADM